MSIFEFGDYRLYLRGIIEALPKRGRGAINRYAAELAVHPSLVSQVLSGTKDFSNEQSHKLAEVLGLSPLETDFFLLLIQRERAGTHSLKEYYSKKLNALKTESLQVSKRIVQDRTLNDLESSIFYSSWLYSAIRLWTSTGSVTADEIAQRFSLSKAKTNEILRFLIETNLCVLTEGKYSMGAQRTHLDSKSPFISKFHSNWRIKAFQAADQLLETELMFSSPVSISKKDFELFREKLIALIKSFTETVNQSSAEEIACLNIDYFWID